MENEHDDKKHKKRNSFRKSFSKELENKRMAAEEIKKERNIIMIPHLREEIANCQDEIAMLKETIVDLNNRLKTKKLKENKEKLWYFAPLLIAIVFISYLVYRGWAEIPTVSINFNVGEIIGGTLAGIGVLIAGAAYAFRQKSD